MIRTFAPPSKVRSFQDFVSWLGVVLRERFIGEPSFSSTASHGSWGRRLPPGVSHASVFPRARAGRGEFSESAFSFQMVAHVSCFSFLRLHAVVSILSFFSPRFRGSVVSICSSVRSRCLSIFFLPFSFARPFSCETAAFTRASFVLHSHLLVCAS